MDVTKLRYRDWDDLIGYCSYSAMPVGRFVLDVHGESRATWPANDALCAALQIINHLQDCGKDYRDLDRVYIPLDAFRRSRRDGRSARRGARLAAVARLHPKARPAHRRHAAARQQAVFRRASTIRASRWKSRSSRPMPNGSSALLRLRDPLSERVHLGKAAVAGLGLVGLMWGTSRRVGRVFAAAHKPQGT